MMTFKAMTWNAENLFAPDLDAGDGEHQRYQQKLQLLARVINDLDPDVVALQEVGGEEPLADLQAALGDTYPHAASSRFPDRRGIRVAFLSKLAISERSDLVDFPPGVVLPIYRVNGSGEVEPVTRMGRGALRIAVSKNGVALSLMTAHLKSKLLSFPRPSGSSFTPRDENEHAREAGVALMRRTAEAVTLRARANALLKGNQATLLILLGDFNDVPEAQTSVLLTGPPGSELGTRGFDRPDQGHDARLFNLAPVIPENRRYSRIHRGKGELLDQILVSEECFPRNQDNRRQVSSPPSCSPF
jgi:endonuclease/exonuclease/phosphatase family metal-dependent hydrolase